MTKITFVLDNVRSAFNVGAIFRTADGIGCSIDLIGITPIPGNDKKLEKTSLNALDSVSWRYYANTAAWIDDNLSDDRGNKLIIAVEEGREHPAISLFEVADIIQSCTFDHIFIVLGHEINGVSEPLVESSNYLLQIPMYGVKNSLNVSTCAGIVGYRVLEAIQ